MNYFRSLKQVAATAGLLALCSLPVALRAQELQQGNPQGSAQDQEQSEPMHHGGRHENELSKLNLSDDQKAQINKIQADAKTQMDAVQNDASLAADQKQAKLKQIHHTAHSQVKQVLTPEQRKQMKADEMARKAARQQSGQAPPPQQ